jgi:hypothetical protein
LVLMLHESKHYAAAADDGSAQEDGLRLAENCLVHTHKVQWR